uniref:Uncharacterized protein n=1 Tax=Sus scrofa TaxID=9823 RepID=A0A8D0R4V2_PIG
MVASWNEMMARPWARVASPARQHGLRPQPLWGSPSGQMKHLRPCALSPSPAHLSCPM